MNTQSKWQEFEEECLIPVLWGWTTIVIALYVAVVVLR